MTDHNECRHLKDDEVMMELTENTQELIESFSSKLAALELEKKNINLRIKDLKDDYTEEGLAVQVVTAAYNQTKKDKKMSDSERFEFEAIQGFLRKSKIVDDSLSKLL
jgi:uncharacterized protein (UPF0335 family)